MLNVLTWVAAVLAAVVLIQSIWVTALCIKAHKRWKKRWMKKNRLHSFAFIALAGVAIPAMWVLCAVLAIEVVALTIAIVSFYSAGRVVEDGAAAPVAPKEKKTPVQRVVFNLTAAQLEATATEEDKKALAELVKSEVAMSDVEALSDALAALFVTTEKSDTPVAGENKCMINIDTIAENFNDGETVTVDALKAKGLVGSDVDYVRVLARGTISKKLTVKVNSFAVDAVKMILLAGGAVVKVA